jgi:hypothetical protein
MKKSFWQLFEIEIMSNEYPYTHAKVIAKKLHRSEKSIYSQAFLMGLKKSEQFLKEELERQGDRLRAAGANNRFKKGQTPPNKGKKQKEFMTTEAIERTKATRFKKGNLPVNHKPVGFERITKDGYVEVKTFEPNVFELKHRVEWIKKYRAIDKNLILVCKGTNKTNCDPDNWELITRIENMKRNTYHNYPKEIANAIQLRGALHRQINKHLKNISHAK